jgi:hypothetical protein
MEHELTPDLLSAWYPEGLYVIEEAHARQALKNNDRKKKYLFLSREKLEGNQELTTFLSGIIQACKISMDEVNIFTPELVMDYRQIQEQFGPSFILMFGIETDEVDLPLVFPHFQLQPFNNAGWISSPDLTIIRNDKTMKTKLWNSLKQAFSL